MWVLIIISCVEAKATTTLNSNSVLTQQVTLCNAVLEGLKLDVTGSMQGINKKILKLPWNLFNLFSAAASVDVFKGPMLGADVAARFRDFLVGGEVNYDISQGTIEKYSTAISLDRSREKDCHSSVIMCFNYNYPPYSIHFSLTGFNTFNASYYQKFNDQVEVAYRANWNNKLSNLAMEIGAKYILTGGNGFIKTKLDNNGRLGLALASELSWRSIDYGCFN